MVAMQNALPLSMGGDSRALAFPSLKDFRVAGGDVAAATFEALYSIRVLDEALRTSGHEAFDSVAKVKHDGLAERAPQNGAVWPKSPLARRLQDLTRLIHADVGLSIAATEMGGFDTHLAQEGQLANKLQEVAEVLSAFAKDSRAEARRRDAADDDGVRAHRERERHAGLITARRRSRSCSAVVWLEAASSRTGPT